MSLELVILALHESMGRILKEYPRLVISMENLDRQIDFAQIFGRTSPVHVEIGSGKGTFLVNQAKAQSEVDFLGIEWANKYYRYAVDRIGRWGLSNVRIIRTDAVVLLRDFVADESVDCFHIYFPDPWPKRRHHKRRFLCHANMDTLLRRLKQAGEIRIVTDHAEYFESIKELIAAYSGRLDEIEFLRTAGATQAEWVGSNFERKYIKDARPIFTLAARKT